MEHSLQLGGKDNMTALIILFGYKSDTLPEIIEEMKTPSSLCLYDSTKSLNSSADDESSYGHDEFIAGPFNKQMGYPPSVSRVNVEAYKNFAAIYGISNEQLKLLVEKGDLSQLDLFCSNWNGSDQEEY